MCILLCFSIRESSFGTHTDASLMCSWGRNPSANGTYINLAINVKRWTEWVKDSIVCVPFMCMRVCVYASNRASLSHSLARSLYVRARLCVCAIVCCAVRERSECIGESENQNTDDTMNSCGSSRVYGIVIHEKWNLHLRSIHLFACVCLGERALRLSFFEYMNLAFLLILFNLYGCRFEWIPNYSIIWYINIQVFWLSS